ncbi:MAG TPA: ABC transporter substrate-binding protein, partial [Magnetococcales bacterium]|nr:ABC transporter substrate-binding protein [Magnetococcales bacterium]
KNSGLEGIYSQPVITMETVAITLTQRAIGINKIDDLKKYNILAYQGAGQLLGTDFAAAVSDNRRYRERLKNELLPTMLYRNRVDVVLSDLTIFHYFRHKMATRVDVEQPITVHHILPPQDFHLVCHDAAQIAAFDQGLMQLRRSGGYQRIVEGYLQGDALSDKEKVQ